MKIKKTLIFLVFATVLSIFLCFYLVTSAYPDKSLPKLEDFKASPTCPVALNSPKPLSCDNPVRIHVKCYGSDPSTDTVTFGRQLTKTEVRNLHAVCNLLPFWLDSDVRVVVVPDQYLADVSIEMIFFPEGKRFQSFRIFATDMQSAYKHEIVGITMTQGGETPEILVKSIFQELNNRGLLP